MKDKEKKFKNVYGAMLQRCRKENAGMYYRYGGRGIKCLWNSFETFKKDMFDS